MTDALHPELTALLLRPINPRRVFKNDGQSHLAAWDVRAHLNRCFGFAGWSAETLVAELIHDLETTTKAQKPARKVAYRAQVRLTIHATGAVYSEWAVGEATMPDFKHGDAHDFALKTAESQALKRCAVNLGSQFGLSLYDNGNTDDVVRGVFAPKSDDNAAVVEAVHVTDEGSEPGVVVADETAAASAEGVAAETPGEVRSGEGATSPGTDLDAERARKAMWGALRDAHGSDNDAARAAIAEALGREVESTKGLTVDEMKQVRAWVNRGLPRRTATGS